MASQSSDNNRKNSPHKQEYEIITFAEHIERDGFDGQPYGTPYPQILGPDRILVRKPR